MFIQLFKIMWHRKGKNFLLLTEIFFSFLVLFATGTFLIEGLRNYYTPKGYDYTDVYEFGIQMHGEEKQLVKEKMHTINQILEQTPEIRSYSMTSENTPYSHNFMTDLFTADDKEEVSQKYEVDVTYFETMDMELAAGRWFEPADKAVGNHRVGIINEFLSNKLYPGESALGKTIRSGEDGVVEYKVVGVVKHFRHDGEFNSPENSLFALYNEQDTAASPLTKVLIEVKAGVDPAWQYNLTEQVGKVSGNWTLELADLAEKRSVKAKLALTPHIALGIVCAFLIFNVALGLFGVLWYNISKRYSEIGIRRALGASAISIRWQMLGEVVVLATIGLFLGLVLALQFPLLGVMNVETSIYMMAIGFSLTTIYLLVALCAWYPSKQAARIEPAHALHAE